MLGLLPVGLYLEQKLILIRAHIFYVCTLSVQCWLHFHTMRIDGGGTADLLGQCAPGEAAL